MAKHARQPTSEELESLIRLAHQKDTFTGRRASVILLSTEGKGTSEVADAVGLSNRHVRRIIDSFNKHGMAALRRRRASGRRRLLSDAQRSALSELLERRPRDFGMGEDVWTLQSLSAVLRSEGISEGLSIHTIQREIKRLGIDWSEVKLRGAVRIPGDGDGDALPDTEPLPVRRGLFADRMLRPGEGILFDDVMRNLREDYAAITRTHSLHMEYAAIYSVKLLGAQADGDWEQAERFDRLMQSHLRELKAARKKQESDQSIPTGDTPAERAAAIVEALRAEGIGMMDLEREQDAFDGTDGSVDF